MLSGRGCRSVEPTGMPGSVSVAPRFKDSLLCFEPHGPNQITLAGPVNSSAIEIKAELAELWLKDPPAGAFPLDGSLEGFWKFPFAVACLLLIPVFRKVILRSQFVFTKWEQGQIITFQGADRRPMVSGLQPEAASSPCGLEG